MADSVLDDTDRLAAALAGFLAAGLANQPFEMAKLLIAQGWQRVGPAEITPELLFHTLREAGEPLTRNAVLQRATGIAMPSGRRLVGWAASFQELVDSGRIVPDGDFTYTKWLPAEEGDSL